MNRVALLVLAGFLISAAFAQVSLPAWDWATYSGTSQWHVRATEDESGCGGGTFSATYVISIEHNLTAAVMGDTGHGPVSGTFEGNTLHIKSRTVPDPPGTSALSDYDVVFTSDCSGFSTTYTWDYSGSDGSCSGSTTLRGTNSQGCPAPNLVPVIPSDNSSANVPSAAVIAQEISDARSGMSSYVELRKTMDSEEQQLRAESLPSYQDELNAKLKNEREQARQMESRIEGQYDAVLQRDPDNFWANWDMAELKREQGKYDEFEGYFQKATSNQNIMPQAKKTLETFAANQLGLTEFPTPEKSLMMHEVAKEARSGGNVYGVELPKDGSGSQGNGVTIFTILSKDFIGKLISLAQ